MLRLLSCAFPLLSARQLWLAVTFALLGAVFPSQVSAQTELPWYGCWPGPVSESLPPAPHVADEDPHLSQFASLAIDGSRMGPPLHGAGLNMEPNLWSCPGVRPVLDAYILGLVRPPLVRAGIAQRPWAPPDSTPEDWSWEVYQRELDAPERQPAWEFLEHLNQNGIAPLLAIWGAPPQMTHDGTLRGRLLPEYHAHFLDYYEAAVDYLVNQRGIQIGATSLMNEPDCLRGDGTKLDPAQYALLATRLGPRLEQYGVRLYGPDTCNADAAHPYLEALLAEPGALQHFAFLGVHQYGASRAVGDFVRQVRQAGLDLPVYVTEYTSFAHGRLDDGQPASEEWSFALDIASILISHLNGGADGVIYWDAMDYMWEMHGAVSRWGLLSGPTDDLPFTPRKRFWSMLQFLPHLSPGSALLEAELDGPPTLSALAVRSAPEDGDQLSIMLVNQGGPVELYLRLSGLEPLSELRGIQSSALASLSDLGRLSIQDGELYLPIPERTVTTLTTRSPGPLERSLPAGGCVPRPWYFCPPAATDASRPVDVEQGAEP